MTIYALASGRGKAGIAVIRLSGPRVGVAIEALTGKPAPQAGTMKLRVIRDPETGEELGRLTLPIPIRSYNAAFDANGSLLALDGPDGTCVWDLATLEKLRLRRYSAP